jgi:hypothetical protein
MGDAEFISFIYRLTIRRTAIFEVTIAVAIRLKDCCDIYSLASELISNGCSAMISTLTLCVPARIFVSS